MTGDVQESVDPMDKFQIGSGRPIGVAIRVFRKRFVDRILPNIRFGIIIGLVLYIAGYIIIPFLSQKETSFGLRPNYYESPLFFITLGSILFGFYLTFLQSIEGDEFLRYSLLLILGVLQIVIPFQRIWQLRYFYQTSDNSYVYYDGPPLIPEGWRPIVNPLIKFPGTPSYYTRVEGYQPFILLGALLIIVSGVITVLLSSYFIYKERRGQLVNYSDDLGSLSDAQLTFEVDWKYLSIVMTTLFMILSVILLTNSNEFVILIGVGIAILAMYLFKQGGYRFGEPDEDYAELLPMFTYQKGKRTHSFNRILQVAGYLGIIGVVFVFLGLEGIVGMRTFLSQPGYIYTIAVSMHITYLSFDPSFRFRLSQSKLAYGFVMPTVLMLIFELYIPILVALYLSFQNIRTRSYAYYSLTLRNENVGFENYRFLINTDLVWIAMFFFIPLLLAKYAWSYADTIDLWAARNFSKLLIVATLISINIWIIGRIFVPSYEAFIDEKSSLFIDPSPVPVFRNTVIWTLASVVSHLILGTLLALLMNTEFRGRGVARAIMIIPWAVPNFITISIFGAFIFDNEAGAINMILNLLHLPTTLWMNSDNILMTAILVNIWLGYPFIMVSILAALQSIPNDVYEAAEIDGATRFTKFFKITLPLIKPTVFVVSLLGFLWTFNLFNVIYLLTFDKASTLSVEDYYILIVYIFNVFSGGNWSIAATFSFVLFLMVAGFSFIYALFVGKGPYEL